MDVRPVGGGPTRTDLTQGAGAAGPAAKINTTKPAAAEGVASALDAAMLSALSEPDLARLTAILEPQRLNVSQVSELSQSVLKAGAAGDVEQTLAGLAQLAGLDPARAEAIRTEPALRPFRAEVDSLVARLAHVAQLDAQSRVAHAAQVLEDSRLNALPDWDAAPHALLLIANRLLEAGGYVNAVRAMQVAQVVVDGSHWAPAPGTVSVSGATGPFESEEAGRTTGAVTSPFKEAWRALGAAAPKRIARLWRRAPLLVLLVAWLVAGTAGALISRVQRTLWPAAWPSWVSDAGFTLWALGFLALVLFGFYIRVRNVRL